ncbi:MAG TPA: 4Fe-4S dicluster domain-containing protein [Spirochaetia bacterium]|nr:4Fe-4S dicluster domain-containing protein [Spirochaetia bacterium]
MFKVSVDADKCEGCGECAAACPASMLEMEDGKATVTGSPDDCLGCETCVVTCPNDAVRVEES